MPSFDLLQAQFALPDRVLDRDRFFANSRELLKQVLAVSGKETLKPEKRQRHVRLYVRHYRAAIVALAHHEDFDTIECVEAAHNVHSQQVLAAGKGLALGEFGILQIHKDTQEELDQEMKEIRKMQRKITKHRSIRLDAYRDREKLKPVREKQKRAAFFQGTQGMADFYHERYDS